MHRTRIVPRLPRIISALLATRHLRVESRRVRAIFRFTCALVQPCISPPITSAIVSVYAPGVGRTAMAARRECKQATGACFAVRRVYACVRMTETRLNGPLGGRAFGAGAARGTEKRPRRGPARESTSHLLLATVLNSPSSSPLLPPPLRLRLLLLRFPLLPPPSSSISFFF